MGKSLIIVESPAKVKTIKNFVGSQYKVMGSMGHVRDLPKDKLGIAIDREFEPVYQTIPEKRQILKELKEAAKNAEVVYLASDPDREGEAIAWHVAQALRLKDPKRIEFNEITKTAITRALQHPRPIDMNRVNAQQARRVLDRLVGYKLSPLLWKKIRKGLSAGRVQSVAVRLICEREREIQAFVPVEYWSITALLTPQTREFPFKARLFQIGPHKLDTETFRIENEQQATAMVERLRPCRFIVVDVKEQEKRRFAPPPFTTSTLQQEAAKQLRFSNRKTMQIAQELYEGLDIGAEGTVGLITYMRTDSVRVAAEAQQEARQFIADRYGAEFVPPQPPQYKSKKGAQEAHEAIRPTAVTRTPDDLKPHLNPDQFRLYQLIWRRFVASQMKPAVLDTVTVDIAAQPAIPVADLGLKIRDEGLGMRDENNPSSLVPYPSSSAVCLFRASGQSVKFPGFLAVYEEGKDEDAAEDEDEEAMLPPLKRDDILRLLDLLPRQHFTQPPPRYTEATLVKALEENGIGRPSTYAQIISTIQEREYVTLENRRFMPTELGFLVNDKLVQHFADIIDTGFTAKMESELDEIEEGQRTWTQALRDFWEPFEADLLRAAVEMERVAPPETDKVCPTCGRPMVVRYNKRGSFIGCSGYPECRTILRVTKDGEEIVTNGDKAALEVTDTPCPKCGKPMVVRESKRGKFLGCSAFPRCRGILPLNGESPQGDTQQDATRHTEQPAAEPSTSDQQPATTDKTCPKCGSPLVVREGKFGKFLGCSAYPKCKTIVKMEGEEAKAPEPLAKCPLPDCPGDIIAKRYRKGRKVGVFYSCNQYPHCTFALWDKPTGEKCEQCGYPLVAKKEKSGATTVSCSNKECGAFVGAGTTSDGAN
jgi:DNA topoisomerase-1